LFDRRRDLVVEEAVSSPALASDSACRAGLLERLNQFIGLAHAEIEKSGLRGGTCSDASRQGDDLVGKGAARLGEPFLVDVLMAEKTDSD